jgi:hypothetical protein
LHEYIPIELSVPVMVKVVGPDNAAIVMLLVTPVVLASPVEGAQVHLPHVQQRSSPYLMLTGNTVKPGVVQAENVSLSGVGGNSDSFSTPLITILGSGKALSILVLRSNMYAYDTAALSLAAMVPILNVSQIPTSARLLDPNAPMAGAVVGNAHRNAGVVVGVRPDDR